MQAEGIYFTLQQPSFGAPLLPPARRMVHMITLREQLPGWGYVTFNEPNSKIWARTACLRCQLEMLW